MTHPPVVRVLLALAVLLAAPAAGTAQARVQAPDLRAHRAPFPSLAPPAAGAEAKARVGRAARIGRYTLVGAAIGAAVGVVTFTVMERTTEHRDHSEDGLVLAVFTVYGTAAGALLGLIAGAV
ncbi:MAG: hypothetical protein AB1941_16500 [Gemmatimonadota bacterium]